MRVVFKSTMVINLVCIVLLVVMIVPIIGSHRQSTFAIGSSEGDGTEVLNGKASTDLSVKKAANNGAWNLPFWAVPAGSDSLYILTDQTIKIGNSASANVTIGQGRIRFAMTYTDGSYEVLATQIPFSGGTDEGTIALTADLEGDNEMHTSEVEFRRFFVPTIDAPPLVSTDNLLEMIVSDHSLPADVYVLIMDINAIPEPVPLGHNVVGQPYSVRSSGAIIESLHPMLLKLSYTDLTLQGADPHTMSIFEWDPLSRQWGELGGELDDWIGKSMTTTTENFSVYSLMSTPRWTDVFTDYSGLAMRENTIVLPWEGTLVLDGLHSTGSAVSNEIAPRGSFEKWDRLSVSATRPEGTTLTVDLLDANEVPILVEVGSDTDLSELDPAQYSSLKLRATFSTDNLDKSASLDRWQITWQPPITKLYTPLIMGSE
jgi:hypothetical protein